jgi:molybdenum cofactor cytidylyltransferase
MKMDTLHILLLAAGASTRLGQPKQLLVLGGQTLLERTCKAALSIDNHGVTVVLGAHCEAIRPAIAHLPVRTVLNERWNEGMGSSIACGMAHLPPDAGAVLLLLCDQPHVTGPYLQKLLRAFRSANADIAASAYGGSFGPPAIFGRRHFPDLAALSGHQGAKKLLERHRGQALAIDFPEGEVDIDTPTDCGLRIDGLRIGHP